MGAITSRIGGLLRWLLRLPKRIVLLIWRFLLWFRRGPKKYTVPTAGVIVLSLSIGGYFAVDFYEYTQKDPSFCRSCHIMEAAWDRWASSEHSTVTCHECHKLGASEAVKLVWQVIFGQPKTMEAHARVPDEACRHCHENNDPKWVQVAATSGHRVHNEEGNVACTKCHSLTVHRFTAPSTICSACHDSQHVQANGMSQMHCTSCHEFLAESEELLPLRKGCLDCHLAMTGEAVTWPADAPMQFPCGECHHPHNEAKKLVDCSSCHPDLKGLHTKAVHAVVACKTCHEPHDWQIAGRSTCVMCHPNMVQHNSGKECASCHTF